MNRRPSPGDTGNTVRARQNAKRNALRPHGGVGQARFPAGRPPPGPSGNHAMKTHLQLSDTRPGRILLHLRCLVRDKRVGWHLRGILREFA